MLQIVDYPEVSHWVVHPGVGLLAGQLGLKVVNRVRDKNSNCQAEKEEVLLWNRYEIRETLVG